MTKVELRRIIEKYDMNIIALENALHNMKVQRNEYKRLLEQIIKNEQEEVEK